MNIDMGGRIDVNQDGPSLIIEVPPPTTEPPKMLMSSHMKNLLSIIFPCCTYMYVSSAMRCLVHQDSTYASPGPPKKTIL